MSHADLGWHDYSCGVRIGVANDGAIGTTAAKAQFKPRAASLIDARMQRAGEL
jgi:hypothetical protein